MLAEILKFAQENKASDIHLVANKVPYTRHIGELKPMDHSPISVENMTKMIQQMTSLEQYEAYQKGHDIDTAYSDDDGKRYRLNIYRQQEVPAVAIRLLNNHIPTLEEMQLPEILKSLSLSQKGIILVTGPTGSGKSTTLAAMINHININTQAHILTLEDPIEYIHTGQKSLINQREILKDVTSFKDGLRSALREDPDVILVGEMRDHESISLALTAAETGHLVLSTLHTTSAASTINRIIDSFEPHQQNQVRSQLSSSLKAVIAQVLLPKKDKTGRIAAHEILLNTDAVGNMIRENKIVQINSVIQTNQRLGMTTLENSLATLVKRDMIDQETAESYATDQSLLQRLV